jgi:hypothetical protein
MREEINKVRMMLGAVEPLVPDYAIEDALKRFSPFAAAHYIRLTLIPRMQHVERKAEAES